MKCGNCGNYRKKVVLSDGKREYQYCNAYDEFLKNFPTTFTSSLKFPNGGIIKLTTHKNFDCDDCKLFTNKEE